MTGMELITSALRLAGVIGDDETPSDPMAEQARDVLNLLIDAWAADRLTIPAKLRNVFTLTANDGSYTIGSGGDLNVTRPLDIAQGDAGVMPTAGDDFEIPMRVLSDQEYARRSFKADTAAYPTELYYDRRWVAGLGTILLFPIQDVSGVRLVLYLPTGQVSEFADLTTDYTFAPGYKRALRTNLAVDLANEYGRAVTDKLERDAMKALGVIKRVNVHPKQMRCDGAAQDTRGRAGWNWRIGE